MNLREWLKAITAIDSTGDWSSARFVTRGRTLFFARLAFLAVGLGILAVPRWAQTFGAQGSPAFLVYFGMILYSTAAYLLVPRGLLGKVFTFATLCLDLLVLIYMITFSGGLRSPVLPTQVIYTIFFALLFPNPLSILPPLLLLPIVAKIDTEIPGRALVVEDIFVLIWYSAVNFIVVYVIVYLNEREERLHNEIVGLQAGLRQLAVAEERNRLAREIHDGLGASLSSLIIQSEYLQTLASEPELKAEIRELKEGAEESIDELRRSISMMREDFDLVPALEDHCQSFAARSGLEVRLLVQGRIPRLLGELSLTVFRVLQEALTNVQKHAKAREVQVGLQCRGDRVLLSVRDDGQGFAIGGTRQGHYGLVNMRERASHAGGDLSITTAPGEGCAIELAVPVRRLEDSWVSGEMPGARVERRKT